MYIAMKTAAIFTLAISLGASANTLASEAEDSSLGALKQEVAELKQIVTELGKYSKNLEKRLQSLERAVPQRDNLIKPQIPINSEIGTWIDDLQMEQKTIQRSLGEGVIHPVEPPR
jgi:septal ring factor EnvC (AmiA/AmiB activator)